MDIMQITDTMKIQPNTVYTNPPNQDVDMINGRFHLIEQMQDDETLQVIG